MRLWITRDDEGFRLWRIKPTLNEDGVWRENNREYEKINTYIYYYITDFADLLRKGEIVEIDIAIVLPFAKQSESKEYIKTRKHK
jgi:hypothetical protein